MNVYTKIEGKLAMFEVQTLDIEEARNTVIDSLGLGHKFVVLALVK